MAGSCKFPARSIGSASIFCLLLAGCAQTPLGPTVQVMPGPGKTFETFQNDQALCKGLRRRSGEGPGRRGEPAGSGCRGLDHGVGRRARAAAGSFSGMAGQGAGLGAASGALVGAGIGAQNSSMEQMGIQQQYDNAFRPVHVCQGRAGAWLHADCRIVGNRASPADPTRCW